MCCCFVLHVKSGSHNLFLLSYNQVIGISTTDSATEYTPLPPLFFEGDFFFLTRPFAGNVGNPTGCENNDPFWAGHFPRWAGPPDPPRPTHDGGACVKVMHDQQVKRERGKRNGARASRLAEITRQRAAGAGQGG